MRILLVEDHQDTRRVLTRLLIRWGFDVTAAENLKCGVDALNDQPIDIILSDIGLPDGTGYTLISEARRRGKNIPAIAVSGFAFPAETRVAKKAGFDHHLSKPFQSQELRTLLEEKIIRNHSSAQHGDQPDEGLTDADHCS